MERDPLVNANPARKPTEMIVGQNVANTPFEAFPLNVLTCFNASLLKASAPSNLAQKSGGGVSRGSQVFLNVSSLITSFYLIPLYLRGPGTISILKKMNEGRALRQLYGKRLSFIDYLS